MTLTANPHRKRSITFTMLLVWAFALLSGMANACLTEPRGELADVRPHAWQADHPAQAALHPHGADPVPHDEHPHKAQCHEFRDESSQTLLKQLPKLDTPDLQATALPVYMKASDLYMAPLALVRAALAALAPPSRPPRVQFSRLAL